MPITTPLEVGTEFRGRSRCLSRARILALSGGVLGSDDWPRRNLHTDAARAAEAGLPAPIASGIQCEGDLVRVLIQLFGEQWFQFGRLNVTHRRPVFVDTWVQACARVLRIEKGETGQVAHLEVWCETPEKDVVTAGTASCVL